jgi:type II secretory pathway pseudopilin PulG
MLLLAVFVIMMSIALPKIREDIRRSQELETMQRGKQYIRAIQLFYRRFGRYPMSVDELEDTNGMRFLRRRYEDPLTRADDWKPVYFGQNKAPLTMGYFGAVLNAGAAITLGSTDQAKNSVLGTPPPSAFDNFGSGSSASDSSQPSAFNNPTGGGGPIIGFSPGKSKDSIIVYKTKSNYEEWEFVYDPAIDHVTTRWTPPPGPPNIGAPGVNH